MTLATVPASSPTNLSAVLPAAPIPSWVNGTRAVQLQIAPGVRIFQEDGKVILGLHKNENLKDSHQYVEFEVAPCALLDSFEETQEYLSKLLSDFNARSLTDCLIFRRLAGDLGELFRIKAMHVEGTNLEIEGTLAEEAQISGSLKDSIIQLTGSSVHFKDLDITGESIVYFDCINSTCENLRISSQSVLMGNLTGLSPIGRDNLIQADATGLIFEKTDRDVPPAHYRCMFNGARISSLFAVDLVEQRAVQYLSPAEIEADRATMNAAYYHTHLASGRTFSAIHPSEGISIDRRYDQNKVVLSFVQRSPLGSETVTDLPDLQLHVPNSIGTASRVSEDSISDNRVSKDSVSKDTAGASEQKNYQKPYFTSKVEEPEKRTSIEVPWNDFSLDLPLIHSYVWYALRLSRGRLPSEYQRILAAQAKDEARKIVAVA